MIGNAVTVKQVHIIAKGLKAVGESFWNEQGAVIVGREHFGMPVEKGGRALAQIDGYVPNFSLQAGDQLHLGMGRFLVVQAANGAASGSVGVIDLGDDGCPAGWCEFLGAEKPRQSATVIAQGLALNPLEPGQW